MLSVSKLSRRETDFVRLRTSVVRSVSQLCHSLVYYDGSRPSLRTAPRSTASVRLAHGDRRASRRASARGVPKSFRYDALTTRYAAQCPPPLRRYARHLQSG